MELGDYAIEYVSLAEFDTVDGRLVDRAVINVYREGEYLSQLYPRRDYFFESQQSMTIPGLYSTLDEDFYVLLVDWEAVSAESATFKLFLNPLVNWLWIGGFVFIVGTFVAAWPSDETVRYARPTRAKAEAEAQQGA